MEIRPLQELQAADEMSLAFNPFGLGGRMRPEDAAEFQQSQIAELVLSDRVAEGTRRSFERLRNVYAYGVLCYDMYTLVSDAALLAFEQALRDRFMESCAGTVTFSLAEPEEIDSFTVTSFEDVTHLVKRLRRRKARLMVNGTPIPFNGMLAGLRRWARTAGLLRGRRSIGIEDSLADLRNHVAHPTRHQVDTPVDAARTLSDLAEFVNQLWGEPTVGGRHFPAPLAREILAMSWGPDGRVGLESPEALRQQPHSDDDAQYVLIRAFLRDRRGRREEPHWMNFDGRYELTRYPVDYLWGPGSRDEALAWHTEHRPQEDAIDFVDRVFLLREVDGRIHHPMRPEVAAGLLGDERSGTWHALRADYPSDAFVHARDRGEAGAGHTVRPGDCTACSVEVLGSGDLNQLLDTATVALGDLRPIRPPALRSPFELGVT
ncbi:MULTISPECIES: hypothetical protein [unclassified Streptomyces]|uniref:hypothetical protein n=1 Tax=unclassified Streptomyces TaxID=2593676 RepID=UPI0016551D01|nr:hypothetical protein [Streptomyces sp. CB02980]MCB8902077.1 hypothetical protein [Streptomyces sp. CB02980]